MIYSIVLSFTLVAFGVLQFLGDMMLAKRIELDSIEAHFIGVLSEFVDKACTIKVATTPPSTTITPAPSTAL